MLKKGFDWLKGVLGFYTNSESVSKHLEEANVRSALYLSVTVIVLEIWMIIRYVYRYAISDEYRLGFGVYVSFHDFIVGKQILAFLTMILFVLCLLIWKPYVSILIIGTVCTGFYLLLENRSGIGILSGDRVNYVIFCIFLIMISVNVYHQRYREAKHVENLNKVIMTDDLTTISNMHNFVNHARDVFADENVRVESKIYLFINIENFKTYNDQFGYSNGNILLRTFAKEISFIFSGEPSARQSDDHFVALTDVYHLDQKIDKIKKVLEADLTEVYMAIKIGGYRPQNRTENPRSAVDKARYACGLIKNKYGESYKEFNEDISTEYNRRQYVVNNIDNAVKNGYIKAYYQPVVWSGNRELCGCEALARWDDPNYGMLFPAAFIPVLEECRQIHKLDACILECACRDLKEAREKGNPVVPVSLNFSRLDFELMDDAVGFLEHLIEKYEVPKEFLHVEITETALIDNDNFLKKSIERFRKDGFSVWLDDFGAGYSSLNVLKDFKFDVMKIDMVFLSSFDGNPVTKDIIRVIIELAERIGMKTVAEGVENEEEARFLKEAGCERLQGYYFGKPVPFETFIAKIPDQKNQTDASAGL